MFSAIIENGNIYQVDYGNKTLIGVTEAAFNEVKNGLNTALNRNEELAKEKENYYQMLVDHGLIQKPKTPEELILETQQQQAEIVKTLNNLSLTLNKLNNRMEAIENEYTRPNKNGQ